MNKILMAIFVISSSFLPAQSTYFKSFFTNNQLNITDNFVSKGQNNVLLVNNIYSDINTVREGGLAEIIELDGAGIEINRTVITSTLASKMYDSKLINDEEGNTMLVSIIDNSVDTKVYVASIDDNLNIVDESTHPLNTSDTIVDVNRFQIALRNEKLYVYGTALIPSVSSSGLFSIVIDLSTSSREVLSTTITGLFVRLLPVARPTKTGWELYSVGVIASDSLMSNWTRTGQVVSNISGRTQFIDAMGFVYAHGRRISGLNNIDGGVLLKLDTNLIQTDRIFFNENSVGDGYRTGISSLLACEEDKTIYSAGALGIDRSRIDYPFSRKNTTLIIKKFDEDLNEIFTRNYGGDAAYDIYHSDLLSGNRIAVSGFRYFDETDVMEGFLLVISSVDGTITSETVYPVQTGAASVFPNPTNDYLRVTSSLDMSLTRAYRYTVIDAQGKTVLQGSGFRPNEDLSVAQLPSGAYTLLFYNDVQRYAAKFIKQ